MLLFQFLLVFLDGSGVLMGRIVLFGRVRHFLSRLGHMGGAIGDIFTFVLFLADDFLVVGNVSRV